jgi:glycosyltransferase involved in cell wall biosynthesis
MKILWLSHLIPYPPKGGVLQRSYYLLREISRYHDIDLLAFNQKGLMSTFYKTQEEGKKNAHNYLSEYCSSVSFIDIPSDASLSHKRKLALKSLFTKMPYTLNWLLSPDFEKELSRHLANNDYDFVHFDTISLAPYIDLCATTPTSLDHHNIESHMLYRRASKESNLLKKIYFWQEGSRLEQFEKIFCPMFDFNFTCSEIDSKRLEKISPESKVHTISNGVDIDYFDPIPFVKKEDRLLFIGTLNWYPNIEAVQFIAKKIFPSLKKIRPGIHIDIIGAHPPQELVELSNEEPNFHVHGFVDDIRPYFRKAKLYICPIKDGGGTKLKILDALSMGMTIVADPIACEGIDVENKKNVIFAENPEQYVKTICDLLSDPDKRVNLEKNARNLAVTKYSNESVGKSLQDLFVQYEN